MVFSHAFTDPGREPWIQYSCKDPDHQPWFIGEFYHHKTCRGKILAWLLEVKFFLTSQ